jgi:hypothetical protein
MQKQGQACRHLAYSRTTIFSEPTDIGGGGSLSADTTLQLYSTGSNGQVNFLANITFGGASTKIIAGNTVNIFNGVTVIIGGTNRASVFTNNANYSGWGGNGTRLGTFGGRGANNPLPLNQAPALDSPGG